MEVGLEVKAEKKVKMFRVSSADCRTIAPLKLPGKPFGSVTKLRCFEETLTEQNWESCDCHGDVVEDSILLGSDL